MTLDEVLSLRDHMDRRMDFANEIVEWAMEVAPVIQQIREAHNSSRYDTARALARLIEVAEGTEAP